MGFPMLLFPYLLYNYWANKFIKNKILKAIDKAHLLAMIKQKVQVYIV